MRTWVRRGLAWTALGVVVWLALTYYYLGPWLPGVIAVALAIGAVVGLMRDAGPDYAEDLWPIDDVTDDEPTSARGFTDGRTRRLRQLCARAEQHRDDAELRQLITGLAPGEATPHRMDPPALEALLRRLEQQ